MTTTLNKIQNFDANKALKKDIDKLMTAVGTNGLCIPIALSYTTLVRTINALSGPVAHFKHEIINALDNDDVMKALGNANALLAVIGNNIKVPNLQIDAKTLKQLNIFNKICLDFNDILPNAMNNMIDKSIDFINDTAEDMWDTLEFNMPDSMLNAYDDTVDFFKEKALSEGFDDLVKLILTPLIIYREFIKSTGIVQLLKRLQKFEKCMTNPSTCNRPKKEFYFTDTNALTEQYGRVRKVYNSQYYIDLFAINLKGEVLLSKMSKNIKHIEKSMTSTFKKIDTYKTPIKR
jgi:hypothetical protein